MHSEEERGENVSRGGWMSSTVLKGWVLFQPDVVFYCRRDLDGEAKTETNWKTVHKKGAKERTLTDTSNLPTLEQSCFSWGLSQTPAAPARPNHWEPEGSVSTIITQAGTGPNTQPLEHWVWLMPSLLRLLASKWNGKSGDENNQNKKEVNEQRMGV